ncbi:SMI1/KNR4 family protein [Pseudoduganella armeniaca]|uniref:SMI1/KNR4 family protein n=1 Tax=Pseudoduganella armeniaca TaxID=2072590 RepID=UPI0015E6A38A|nr:SMI1/KNR4 family protein [Pseudoduganella armeniaca]
MIEVLLQAATLPPDATLPAGIPDTALQQLQAAFGRELPPQLVDWLRRSNGPCAGPGGLFGYATGTRHLDIDYYWELYPAWRERGWIPVAGDGCGNYYVLLATGAAAAPVAFIDTAEGDDTLAYLVASDLWHFIDFYLRSDAGEGGWPFDQDDVLASDPMLANAAGAPLPWLAD